MPELIEQMYSSQQIVVPPKFPYILKRYCKAAIKTQPYDLLRWSYEYFSALAQNRPPPVKLRLEYPIYQTESGLTRGCLKVMANQLLGSSDVPLPAVRTAWQGFCLDPQELKRIFCLCEVYMRADSVPFLHFIAVSAGLLTKTLTHTMILLCETLTKEPDGGSAAIPVDDFLTMYRMLAAMDASRDVKYLNGYREGHEPKHEAPEEEEEETELTGEEQSDTEPSTYEYWQSSKDLKKISLINDLVPQTARLSDRLYLPVIGKIQRSASIERAGEIERENYLRERKGRAAPSEDVDRKLQEMSASKITSKDEAPGAQKQKEDKVEKKKEIEIIVTDEDSNQMPYEIYGEPKEITVEDVGEETLSTDEEAKEEEIQKLHKSQIIKAFVDECYNSRKERRQDLEQTFEEIAAIVDRFNTANYDLGMVAGRQMSTTSGEFIVANIEKEIMDYVNEQIAILPDPELKRKKAKPEEVAMVRNILDNFLDENMDVIAPEIEEIEEEEQPIPDIIQVYAVPGIGPPVDQDIMKDFEEYALDVCKVQADLFMPRNIRHFLCPPVEKFDEPEYEKEQAEKEQVPTGGVITD